MLYKLRVFKIYGDTATARRRLARPRKQNLVHETQMCAVNLNTKGDTCAGDSGGPLMYRSALRRLYFLAGLTSGSMEDCSAGVPAYYTRVSDFKDFIAEHAPETCFQDASQ